MPATTGRRMGAMRSRKRSSTSTSKTGWVIAYSAPALTFQSSRFSSYSRSRWPGLTPTPIVNVVDSPKEVNLWQATNPDGRDFRVDTIGKAYKSTPLREEKKGVYVAQLSNPPKGFTAFFVELTYPGPGKYPFKFTTEVSVVPDILPYRFEDAAKKYPLKPTAK